MMVFYVYIRRLMRFRIHSLNQLYGTLEKISVLSRTNFLAYNAYLIRLSKSVSGGIYNLSQTLNTFNELTRERASMKMHIL